MKTVIHSSDRATLNLGEIFRHKDLLRNIAVRDVTIRYKQTWLGILWALIRPCFNIAVFGAIRLLITKEENALESFLAAGAGIVIWTLITACITDSSNSLLANSNLLTKVYFPKIILPLSSLVVCVIDFLIALVIYLILFFVVHGFSGPQLLLLPLFILQGLVVSLGAGLFFSSLNVKYRDINFGLPFLLQFLYYGSPVFLATSFYLDHLPPTLQKIYLLNPLVHIIDGFKYCLYGEWLAFNAFYFFTSLAITLLILFLGLRYFLKFEKSFADHI